IEVGHAGQNICLQAVALGLGTVPIGAFSDQVVKDVLGVREEPIYILPIGKAE
ncbi:MAG: nitroreductase family protein, partial [Candidatus Omnitrophica bacterium]|nr:nitroreductase family protein [Candidatus Omnitrophota bacterium]